MGTIQNSIPLKPGMSISANLRLRDKPIISLVSDIFVEQLDSVKVFVSNNYNVDSACKSNFRAMHCRARVILENIFLALIIVCI